MRGEEIDEERGAFLLKCLGPPSAAEPVVTYQAWRNLVLQTQALDVVEDEKSQTVRSVTYGQMRMKCEFLLTSLGAADLSSPEGYCGICHVAAQFAARALQNAHSSEFCAALALLETVGCEVLKKAERASKLAQVLEPSAKFANVVLLTPAAKVSGVIEFQRMQFMGKWSVFYTHFHPSATSDALTRLFAVVERHAALVDEMHVRSRALDTVISLGRAGALREEHLNGLIAEGGRVSPSLSLPARAKLSEALASAVACSTTIAPWRQEAIIEGIAEAPTRQWLDSHWCKAGASAAIASAVSAAMKGSVTLEGKIPDLTLFLDHRTLLNTFIGIVNRSNRRSREINVGDAKDVEMEDGDRHVSPAIGVCRAWAPGIFALVHNLTVLEETYSSQPGEPYAIVVSKPAALELHRMLGDSKKTAEQVAPVDGRLDAFRRHLWELRETSIRAARVCLCFADIVALPEVVGFLRSLAEVLSTQRPHVADLLLKDIFFPLFQSPDKKYDSRLPSVVMSDTFLREGVRVALVELLEVPDVDAVRLAMLGLSTWAVQLWNRVARGEEGVNGASPVAQGLTPGVGDFLHAASVVLRVLPGMVLKPILNLVVTLPTEVFTLDSDAGASEAFAKWRSFVATGAVVRGKTTPSDLVTQAAPAVHLILRILSLYFRIQCKTLGVILGLQSLQNCPALAEAAQLLGSLPNTSEVDVAALLTPYFEDVVQDSDQLAAIRATLHESSNAHQPGGAHTCVS